MGWRFIMSCSACLLEHLSGKFCFGFVVGSCVFICRAGFHLLSVSADSTMEFLKLCIPAWDVFFPPTSRNCFFGSAEDGSLIHSGDVAPSSGFCSFHWLFFFYEILASLLFCSSILGTVFCQPVAYPAWWQEVLVYGHFLPAVVPHDVRPFWPHHLLQWQCLGRLLFARL